MHYNVAQCRVSLFYGDLIQSKIFDLFFRCKIKYFRWANQQGSELWHTVGIFFTCFAEVWGKRLLLCQRHSGGHTGAAQVPPQGSLHRHWYSPRRRGPGITYWPLLWIRIWSDRHNFLMDPDRHRHPVPTHSSRKFQYAVTYDADEKDKTL